LPFSRSVRAFLLVPFLLLASAPSPASTSEKKLAPNYRHWLDVEVPYIINADERKQFLELKTDTERDSFIEAFWKIRNPDPNSDVNAYKEEHYRRLTYANEHFGNARYGNGWRTAMGRIYIVLGPPKQRASYHEQANLRPMEIWFFQSETSALPPFFNILFYKHSGIEDWRIYSPTMDGPVALVTTGESQNDPKMALRFIKQSAGDEVARTTLSLLPTEPVDLDNPSPTMESDMMLATINDLPDNPLNKEQLTQNRLRERVTTSILTGETPPQLSYTVYRDDQGGETLSYLLKSQLPDPRLIGPGPDKTLEYDVTLRTDVLTSEGKTVYQQNDALTGKVSGAQAGAARQKPFAAEARLPLVPGNYVIVATLTNNLNHVATRQHASITVPEAKSGTVRMSPLLAYAAPAATPDPGGTLPFSASKFRFTPRGAQTATIRSGDRLPLVFQLWLDPKAPGSQTESKIHLRYVFGAVNASHDPATTEEEIIDAANRDLAGNLLTGHTVDTSQLAPGTYRLVVGANWEGQQQTAYESMNLHVVSASEHIDTWTAYAGVAPDVQAVDDLKRGLAAEALRAEDEAQRFYSKALSEGPAELRPLDQLAALLARRGETDQLAALSTQPLLAEAAASPRTLLLIAEGLQKTGNQKGIVQMLEAQIKLQPPDADLYRTLANACEAIGNTSRARDLRAMATNVR
jgi:GWxTD domain-containing protein